MWTLLFFLVVQHSFVSSEPADKENHRESRQLNFGDCCPCPGAGSNNVYDQSTQNARMASSDICPCLSSDSQPESSVFSPAFRSVESFMRPVGEKKDPKPLLQPEVGLASSVLETLHEVTDQEYQEALARDAAKKFLKVVEPDTPATESRNVVNIILSPKGDYSRDLIPEATHVKETRCIPPTLGIANSFQPLKLRSPASAIQQVLDSSKLGSNSLLHRKLFDMDGSASNLQQSVIQPFQSSIFDDIKTKSHLLKLKLFSNALKNSPVNTNYRNVDQGYGNSNRKWADNDYNTQVSNNKFPQILDQLQKPVPDTVLDRMHSEMRTDDDEESLNCLSNPIRNDINYNPKQRTPLQNQINPALENNDLSNSRFSHKASASKTNNEQDAQATNIEQDIMTISKPEPKAIIDEENFLRKSDFLDTKTRAMPESKQDIDSKASLTDTEENKDLDTITENKVFIEYDIGNQNFTEKSVKGSESNNKNLKSEEQDVSSQVIKKILPDEVETNFDDENDMKSDSTFNDIKTTNLGLTNKECVISPEYDENARSSYSNEPGDPTEHQNISPYPIGKDLVETSIPTTQKTNILPNIKADILATLENFKKANERIHEKLRSNVQDALQSVSLRSVPLTESNQALVIPSSNEIEKKQKNNADISTQDLQEMSDLLLDLSSLKNGTERFLTNNEQPVSNGPEKEQIDFNKISVDINTPEENIETDTESGNESIDKNNSENQIEKNNCDNKLIPKSASSSSALNNEEMTVQASNSVLNRIPHQELNLANEAYRIHQSGINTNRNPVSDVKHFFDNIRSSVKGIFHTDKDFDTYQSNVNDGSKTAVRDYIFKNALEKDPEHHVFTLNDDREHDDTRTLNYYKARVASPQLLNRNPSFPPYTAPSENCDTLSAASEKLLSQNLRWPVERPSGYNLKSPGTKYLKETISQPYIPKPKIFQDISPSKYISLGENLRSRTENSLKTIHDYLDATFMDPLKLKESNILAKSIMNRNNLLEPLIKPYEKLGIKGPTSINTRTPLQAYQPRMPNEISDSGDINRRLNKNIANILKNIENYEGSKQFKQTPLKSKQAAVPLNKELKSISPPTPNRLTELSIPNRLKNIDKLNIKHKGRLSPQQTNLTSKKLNIKSLVKTPLKNNIKLKPLKESKVTILFTTTSMRPDTLKSSLRSKIEKGSLKPKSTPIPRNPPKLSKNILDKRTNIQSNKLKSSDPQTLASENIISQIPVADATVDTPTYAQWLYSDEALGSSQNSNQDDFKHSNDRYRSNVQELPEDINKINAIRFLNSNRKNPKNNFLKISKNSHGTDATLSASDNVIISAPTSLEAPLKENVSYKCKMVCVKDLLDTTS